jgi:hypothetical protein
MRIDEAIPHLTKWLMELKNYRDTGLTPEQIEDIDKLYQEKCEEVCRQHESINLMSGEILRLKDNRQWIPVTERLPECEKRVMVTVERRYKDKTHRSVCLAFYEDGKVLEDNSNYRWDTEGAEYSEEHDSYYVPEGWWESVTYSDEFSSIGDFVTAWRPMPESYREVLKDEKE